jgi:hypothetical protein
MSRSVAPSTLSKGVGVNKVLSQFPGKPPIREIL